MAEDLTKKIQELLANPEAQNMISTLMNSRAQDSGTADAQEYPGSENDYSSKLQSVVSSFNNGSDKRINLLNALKPYMHGNKASSIDKAIKMLKLTHLSTIFKDL